MPGEGSKSQQSTSSISSGSDADSSTHYYIIEGVESLRCYRHGGYHLVAIGDRFNNRYKVIQKLGFGSYSTIWLARDEQSATNVAIKIGIAENDRPHESIVLSVLHAKEDVQCERLQAGKAAIPRLFDEFEVTGRNGSHHCIVTSPARASLANSITGSRFLLLPVARAIAAQIVQAVAFLHEKGVVHGDLNFGNILFDLPESIKRLAPNELYEAHGEPEYEEVVRIDEGPVEEGIPECVVHSARLWNLRRRDIKLEEAKILLTDYGESFQPATTTRLQSRTPLILRPPEQLTGTPSSISYPADVWALGCTIFQVLGFRSFVEGWFVSADRTLADQVEVLGRLPPTLWASWTNRGEYFNEALERRNGSSHKNFRERMDFSIGEPRRRQQSVGEMDEGETQALEDLLRSMLALDVHDRISAKQALESEWMVKWALPDLERARSLWGNEFRSSKSAVEISGHSNSAQEGHASTEEDEGAEQDVHDVFGEDGSAGIPAAMVEEAALSEDHETFGKGTASGSEDVVTEDNSDADQVMAAHTMDKAEQDGDGKVDRGQATGCLSS